MPSSARVALITGCGKPVGIGNSTARALAAVGVTVVVSDVVPTGVANEHNAEGDMDSSWQGVDSLVEDLTSGRLDHDVPHHGVLSRVRRQGGLAVPSEQVRAERAEADRARDERAAAAQAERS